MKKIIYLTLLFFVLIVSYTSYANAETIYSGQVLNKQSVLIQNDNYTLRGAYPVGVDLNFTKLILRRTGSVNISAIIDIGKCYNTDMYFYCFDSLTFSDDPSVLDDAGYFEPYLALTVKKNVPSISVNKPNSVNIDYNTQQTETVTVSNNDIRNAVFYYTEKFPQEVQLIPSSNCVISNSVLTTSFNVPPNSAKSFSYTARLLSYNTVSGSNATYTYYYGDNTTSVTLPPTIFSVNTPFSITYGLSSSDITNLDSSTIDSFILTNNDPNEDISYNVILDFGLAKIVTTTGLSNSNRYINLSGVLSSGKHYSFSTTLKPINTGNYYLQGYATISTHGRVYVMDLNKSFNVHIGDITPTIVTGKDVINSGDKLFVNLSLTNNDQMNSFYSIHSVLNGLDITSTNYSVLSPSQYILLLQKNITVPNIPYVNVSFYGDYYTRNGQEFKFYTSKIITVNQSLINRINITNVKNTSTNLGNTLNTANSTRNDIHNNSLQNSTAENSNGATTDSKKDFLSSIFESLNKFISKLFGSK